MLSRGANLETLKSSNWFKDSDEMFALTQPGPVEIESSLCRTEDKSCKLGFSLETGRGTMKNVGVSENSRGEVNDDQRIENGPVSMVTSRVTRGENGTASTESESRRIENEDHHIVAC